MRRRPARGWPPRPRTPTDGRRRPPGAAPSRASSGSVGAVGCQPDAAAPLAEVIDDATLRLPGRMSSASARPPGKAVIGRVARDGAGAVAMRRGPGALPFSRSVMPSVALSDRTPRVPRPPRAGLCSMCESVQPFRGDALMPQAPRSGTVPRAAGDRPKSAGHLGGQPGRNVPGAAALSSSASPRSSANAVRQCGIGEAASWAVRRPPRPCSSATSTSAPTPNPRVASSRPPW
jgi:hypothetical protein